MDKTSIMQAVKYYEDVRNRFLLAYEKHTEFFVRYIPETKQWEDCPISFSNFQHDYEYREIGKEEMLQRTEGNFPEANLEGYLAMLRKDMGL